MKIYATSAVLIGLMSLLMTSCTDNFLTEENIAGVTKSLYQTADGFEKGVNAAYQTARSIWGTQRGAHMTDLGTDIWTHGSHGGNKHFDRYGPLLNPEDGWISDQWTILYEGINTINTVLAHAQEVENMDPALKEIRVGELKYLRGLYYFMLVRWWGAVPLHLEPVTGVDTEESRTPVPEVYAAIIKDLEEAVNVLPAEQADWGRATKGAAQHLLALVYLTRGYTEAGQPSDFQKAADLAQTVIESGRYRLLEDYAAWFDIHNQINEEVIWSVQYTQNVRTNGDGNSAHLYYRMYYELLPGLKRTIEYGRPWIRIRPTKYLYNLYDISKDARYEKSFQTVWLANEASSIPTDESGDPLYALGDTTVWFPHPDVNPAKYQNKEYRVFPPEEYYGTLLFFPTLDKHTDPLRPTIQWTAGSRDFIVFRLAETYLIAAEALFKAGMIGEATRYLNTVRERAAWPGKEDEMRITSAQVTLDFILDEWARETAGEYQRWFTLVRTGKLVERVRKYNPQGGENIQPYHALRPIPQAQIDAVNGDFRQNPGY